MWLRPWINSFQINYNVNYHFTSYHLLFFDILPIYCGYPNLIDTRFNFLLVCVQADHVYNVEENVFWKYSCFSARNILLIIFLNQRLYGIHTKTVRLRYNTDILGIRRQVACKIFGILYKFSLSQGQAVRPGSTDLAPRQHAYECSHFRRLRAKDTQQASEGVIELWYIFHLRCICNRARNQIKVFF